MNGRVVFTESIFSDSETIDLSGLPLGIYYAEINSVLKKFIVYVLNKSFAPS